MKRVTATALGATAVAALVAGCGSSSNTSSSATTPTATASSSAPAPSTAAASTSASATASGVGVASVKAENSSLGQILTDASGHTLYLFKSDTGTTSTCNGACAQAWPPLLTSGKPTQSGLNESLVGTTVRTDHTTEVTYNGHPLYTFEGDTQPGQTHGQGVTAFGAAWYVVDPSGNAVTTAPSSPASSSTPTSGGGGGGY